MTKQNERAIVGAILKKGRFYRAGDEDALAKVLPQSDIDRHVASGQLSGDWGGASAAEASPSGESAAPPAATAHASKKPVRRK